MREPGHSFRKCLFAVVRCHPISTVVPGTSCILCTYVFGSVRHNPELIYGMVYGKDCTVARENNRLSAIGLATRPPGFHADGRGLYFSVSGSGSRSWIFRYMLRGKSRDMGLGPFPDVGLAGARAKAEDARALCRDGVDPLERREADRKAKSLEEARSVTFRDCTTLYFEANKAAWRNPNTSAIGN
jgi:hypothetical protein